LLCHARTIRAFAVDCQRCLFRRNLARQGVDWLEVIRG
jgi:hypothetical protein